MLAVAATRATGRQPVTIARLTLLRIAGTSLSRMAAACADG